MKFLLFVLLTLLFSYHAYAQPVNKVDPGHADTGGYGYMIGSDSLCSIWWAEGAYKVMRDAQVPERKDNEVKLWSAGNEYESLILVARPSVRMDNFRIEVTPLVNPSGNFIDAGNISVRMVGYVKVTRPTDAYAFPGWWPDPLPLYEKPQTLYPAENQPFWITVKTPAGTPPGDYAGTILLSSGSWQLTVPVKLHVWDFQLPSSPSMRSGFGFDLSTVKKYENIRTAAEEQTVFDNYMRSFSDYRISPYNPFELSPIREKVTGVAWEGGFFDRSEKYSGTYSYKLVDNSAISNTGGTTKELIPVTGNTAYRLGWFAKSPEPGQQYVAGVECFNAERELLVFENRFEVYSADDVWKPEKLDLGNLCSEIRYVRIRLFPSNRTLTGEHKGTVWFDDISLVNLQSGKNEFSSGDFEVSIDDIDIELDFTDFNAAGKRYFDEFGFTAYRLTLKGLGGGTYYSRNYGVFEGFEQGTVEYNKLMERYLSQMQENLDANGWLGREYIYWFDEPNEADYPFVKETNALIKQYAPGITTFLTEHVAGQDISDVTDISCTIWHKLDHDKIGKMNDKGLEHWSYLCCWPKSPWISEFIDHDAVNLRMWLWGSYKHRLKGILVWETTYWNSDAASPAGWLQNPWEEAMSFVTGYGWPLGKQTIWGNGDGRFFYPNNRDPNNDKRTYTGMPVPSMRLELLRDGIEDYEYFMILEKAIQNAPRSKASLVREAASLLSIPSGIYTDEKTYSKNPEDILLYRRKLADMIVKLSK
jgi:hypothetical protein